MSNASENKTFISVSQPERSILKFGDPRRLFAAWMELTGEDLSPYRDAGEAKSMQESKK
jgi:hypothetical protein